MLKKERKVKFFSKMLTPRSQSRGQARKERWLQFGKGYALSSQKDYTAARVWVIGGRELRWNSLVQMTSTRKNGASTWWWGPLSRLSWVEMAVGLPEGPSHPGLSPFTNHFFAALPSERPQKVSMQLL